MAGKGSVKLSIYSVFDDKGTKQGERAITSFTKKYGEVVTTQHGTKLAISDTTTSLLNQSIQADQASAKWAKYSDGLGTVGSAATKYATLPILAIGTASVVAAVEIDTALTGVRKTVDGTSEQYEQLKQAAIEFSKTNAVSASQILDIQSLGAQLGFTIDELDMFSQVVSGLDIATNMDAETAATELAQFANITKMSHGEVSNYGSAIVGLGNNFATTESDISSMAMRIAASGKQVGMSQADILGVATALSSLGVEAEAGGSAISTIMAQIDKDIALAGAAMSGTSDLTQKEIDKINGSLETWASTAGMSAEDFSNAWKNDPVDALSTLLSSMEGATAEGSNMSVMLDELGIDSIRQTDVMKRLAGNSDLVSSAVSKSNEEWVANTALTKEVENRNDSLEAKFIMLKNKAVAVGESIGGPVADAMLEAADAAMPLLEGIGDAARSFSELDKESQQMIIGAVAAAAAFGPIASGASKAAGFVSGAYDAYGKFSARLSKFSTTSKGASVAAKGLSMATKGIGVAAVATFAVMAASEIADFATGLNSAKGRLEETADSVVTFGDRMENAKSTVTDMNATLTASGSTIGDLSATIAEKEQAITDIIATALAEQRGLRDEDIQAIAEYNAQIERLQQEKLTAYQAGMQGIVDSVEVEGKISADRAAELLVTVADYQSSSMNDLDAYHNTRLQKLSQQHSVEGSMTEEQYKKAVEDENQYYDSSRKNIEKSVDNSKTAIASHTEAIKGFSDEQVKAMELIADPWWKSTASLTDALNTLVTDTNSSFLAMQATVADGGGKITGENAEMIDTLLSQFEGLPVGLEDQAATAMRALAEGLDDELGIDIANSTSQQIIDAYRSKIEVAGTVGEETSKNYADSLSISAETAVNNALLVSGMTMDQFAVAAISAGVSGDAATLAFAQSIINGAPLVGGNATAVAGAAQGGLSSVDGSGAATSFTDPYLQTIVNAQPGANTAGTGLGSEASAGADSADGAGPGTNFASGFVGEIGNWLKDAWDAGWNLVSNALSGGNAAQEAQSPAKKTKEMAKWYALGFIEETERRQSDAYDAGYSLMSASLSGSDAASADYSFPPLPTKSRAYKELSSLSAYTKGDADMLALRAPSLTNNRVQSNIDAEQIALEKAIADAIVKGLDGMGVYVDDNKLVGAIGKRMTVEFGRIEKKERR